jgi:hypothetical protein
LTKFWGDLPDERNNVLPPTTPQTRAADRDEPAEFRHCNAR